MKAKFKVYVTRDISEHEKFEDALKAFFEQIFKMIDEGVMAYQHLETACWIEGTFEIQGETFKAPLYFYDARDFAHDNNILEQKDGKTVIADPLPTIPIEVTSLLFAKLIPEQLRQLMKL